jgi:hypothetical protein
MKKLLQDHLKEINSKSLDENITDLLVDLMHLCRNNVLSWNTLLDRGKRHFEIETIISKEIKDYV